MFPSASATTDNHFWEQERSRLVTLCTRLTGNQQAAEDLAQETLYEAWRHRERLHDAGNMPAWLAAIARNICLRWRTQYGRTVTHQLAADVFDHAETLADPFDIEAAVEQSDTRQLLERALALLPVTTRQAFLEHCLIGVPFAAIARRQGLAEDTVKMQVHRGKLRLRQILATTFAAEAAACGLLDHSEGAWLPTPLWCPRCGQRHMEGRWDFAAGTFMLRCHDCCKTTGIYSAYADAALFQGVKSLKAGFNRVMRWANGLYPTAIAQGGMICDCGRFIPLVPHLPESMPDTYEGVAPEHYRQIRGVHLHCPACNGFASMHLANLALYHPTAWRFWGQHRRIRTLAEQEIRYQQRPALLLPFQSVSSSAQLDVIVARDTYALLDIRHNASRYY